MRALRMSAVARPLTVSCTRSDPRSVDITSLCSEVTSTPMYSAAWARATCIAASVPSSSEVAPSRAPEKYSVSPSCGTFTSQPGVFGDEAVLTTAGASAAQAARSSVAPSAARAARVARLLRTTHQGRGGLLGDPLRLVLQAPDVVQLAQHVLVVRQLVRLLEARGHVFLVRNDSAHEALQHPAPGRALQRVAVDRLGALVVPRVGVVAPLLVRLGDDQPAGGHVDDLEGRARACLATQLVDDGDGAILVLDAVLGGDLAVLLIDVAVDESARGHHLAELRGLARIRQVAGGEGQLAHDRAHVLPVEDLEAVGAEQRLLERVAHDGVAAAAHLAHRDALVGDHVDLGGAHDRHPHRDRSTGAEQGYRNRADGAGAANGRGHGVSFRRLSSAWRYPLRSLAPRWNYGQLTRKAAGKGLLGGAGRPCPTSGRARWPLAAHTPSWGTVPALRGPAGSPCMMLCASASPFSSAAPRSRPRPGLPRIGRWRSRRSRRGEAPPRTWRAPRRMR